MEEWRLVPRILNLVPRWRFVIIFTPHTLNLLLLYPLDKRLGGPQSHSERCGEEKIIRNK